MGVAGGAKQNHSLVRGEHVPPWKDRQKQRERCVSVTWTTLVPRLVLSRPGLVCMTPARGPGVHSVPTAQSPFLMNLSMVKGYYHFTLLVDHFIFLVCTGQQEGLPEYKSTLMTL